MNEPKHKYDPYDEYDLEANGGTRGPGAETIAPTAFVLAAIVFFIYWLFK